MEQRGPDGLRPVTIASTARYAIRRLVGAAIVLAIIALMLAWAFYHLYWRDSHERS